MNGKSLITDEESELGLSDAVSVIPVGEDGSYLLLSPAQGKEIYWILTKFVQNQSWRSCAKMLMMEYFGIETNDETLIKLYNIWLPGSPDLHHAVFEVGFPNDLKKRLRLKDNNWKLRWFNSLDIQMLASKKVLRSPELLDYLPAFKKKFAGRGALISDYYFHPEGNILSGPTSLSSSGPLIEICKDNILIRTDGDASGTSEQLMKLSNLFENEQKMIYREFLSLCFPNLLMNQQTFSSFMLNFGWRNETLNNIFHAADLNDKGAITYREFLSILAACEPKTPHGGRPAEIRCRYIFRFYDMNRDNKLDYNEMKQLLIAVRIAKNLPIRSASLEKELDSCNKDMGLNPRADMTLALFMRGVGELKIRGTSSLLRSPTSVIDYFINRTASPYTTLIDSTASSLFRSELSMKSFSGVTKQFVPTDAVFTQAIQKDEFHICGHVAEVGKKGLQNVNPIDEIPFGKTASVTETFLDNKSVELFSRRFPPNEILAGLHYFAEKIDANDYNVKKLGRKPKPAFNWGQVDFHGFACCLINVCDMLSEVVKQEPRLMHINSPVYVMGDLHGNFPDLVCFESLLWRFGPHLSPCNLLFLGDYVDRGIHGVEVISYLFSYKLLNTKKLNLVRGNHEIREVQKMFSFLAECQKKFGKDLGYNVWNNVNRVFDNLPLAAVIDNKIFCCHGGIPPPWLCPTIESINNIPVPLHSPEEQSSLAWEIMWNDPIRANEINEKVTLELLANEGFAVNTKRGTAHMFDISALQKFLSVNELTHVIRAHEAQFAGFQIHQSGKLFTIFSSSHYCGGNNEAACILVFNKELRVFRIDSNSSN